jgi:VWFA-related protein
MSIYRPNFRSAVCLLAALAAGAQEVPEVRVSAKPYAPAPLALRVDTDLVEVGVVVRGRDGQAISGLKRENFVVSDQGSPRDLIYFAVETPGAARGDPPTAIASGGLASPAVGSTTKQPEHSGRAARPRFIALYFEDFGTNRGDLKRAQVAARRFVNEGLDDSDRVAVFSSSGDFIDYTSSKSKLIAAIDKLRPHPKFSEAGLGGCPRISPYQAYLITEMSDPGAIDAATKEAGTCASSGDDSAYSGAQAKIAANAILEEAEITWGQVRIASQVTLDAMSRAITSLQTMPGPRLFLLVSSGFNSATLEVERDQLISQALRAGIVISSVDAKGLYAAVPSRGPNEEINTDRPLPVETFRFETSSIGGKGFADNQVMSDLAQATGGLFFHNHNDLPYGFRQLGSIPEVSYVLGFRQNEAGNGKYHKLKVTLSGSNPYVIQARPGYFANPPGTSGQVRPVDRESELDREVSGVSTLADLAATVAFRLGSGQSAGMRTVMAQIHVAIDRLQFPVRDGRRVQRLKVVAALLDGNGNIVAAKEGTMDFAMTDATYARLSAKGINAGLNLDVPYGKYRLRTVVQESVEGKMASSTLNIEIK